MLINSIVRGLWLLLLGSGPFLLATPCLCCIPRSRKFIIQLGTMWILLYVMGVVLGPTQVWSYVLWVVRTFWLGQVLNLFGLLFYYLALALGVAIGNIGIILVLTIAGWIGFTVWQRRATTTAKVRESP